MTLKEREYYIEKAIGGTFISCGRMYKVVGGRLSASNFSPGAEFKLMNLFTGEFTYLSFDGRNNDDLKRFVNTLQ